MSNLLLDEARAFCEKVHKQIPLAGALDFQVSHYDGHSLVLTAPLAKNYNDKGTAFAGSIYSIAVISGWFYTMLLADREFGPCEVAAGKTQMDFTAPLEADLVATVVSPSGEDLDAFRQYMERKGRARLPLEVILGDGKQETGRFSAAFSAWRK